ncbi:predicted protein [Coccidioides posadasii str. Silveira]|uniref:Predicted protein n=1 Tax=Coccidioides posadasii (strain RMSCC 757 / Silveira) TaxID=443226 RepID=E9D4F9_COCPS|nr:predicted protein [Coccidioides posadasii str. Silveira]
MVERRGPTLKENNGMTPVPGDPSIGRKVEENIYVLLQGKGSRVKGMDTRFWSREKRTLGSGTTRPPVCVFKDLGHRDNGS